MYEKYPSFRQFMDSLSLTLDISNDDCALVNYLLDVRNLIRHKINYCIFSFICVIKEQQNHVAYDQQIFNQMKKYTRKYLIVLHG